MKNGTFVLFFSLFFATSTGANDGIIEVWLDKAKLYYFNASGQLIKEYSIAVPKFRQRKSFTGTVIGVDRNPYWIPTEATRRAYLRRFGRELPKILRPGDPRNAMGSGRIRIAFNEKYANPVIRIHGTNNERSIGQNVTRGCIRMRNANILELIDIIEKKKVTVKFFANSPPK